MTVQKIVSLFLIMLLASTAFGCARQARPENIVFPDKELKEYIKKARAGGDLDNLYMDTVLLPVSDYLGAISMAGIGYLPPIKNIGELEKALKALEKGNAIGIINDALSKCNEHIEGKDVKVYLFPADPDNSVVKYNGGVQGFAFAMLDFFLVEVNPTAENWQEMLQYTVAHEYHHVVTGYNADPQVQLTLLDALVFEGRADSFARIVFPEIEAPWLDRKAGPTELTLMQNALNKPCRNLVEEWGRSGYATGYTIVQEFLAKNPGVSVDEWSTMPPAEILEQSGFNWEVRE